MTKRRKQRGGLRPDKWLSTAEEKQLREYVDEQAAEGSVRAMVNRMIIMILLDAGLRASELTTLRIADTPAGHGKDAIWVDDGKGRVDRVVDIPKALSTEIRRFVKLYRRSAKPGSALIASEAGYRRLQDHGTVERSCRLTYSSLYHRVRRIGEMARVKLYPHKCRHTFGMKTYNVAEDTFLTQDQLGHASVETTRVYARTNSASRRQQVERLNAPLFSDNLQDSIGKHDVNEDDNP